MTEYLHFYFDDAGIPLFSRSKSTYTSYIDKQIAKFNNRLNIMQEQSNLQKDEFDKILDLLTTDESGVKQKIYAGEMQGFGTASGLNDMTYSKLGNMSAQELQELLLKDANQIANSISIFQKKLIEYLDTAYQKLSNTTVFSSYQRQVVIDYATTKQIYHGGIKQQIIADFLQHDGLNKLNLKETSSGYETAIRNLTLLAYALPELINFANQSEDISYSTGYSVKNGESRIISGTNKLPELFRVISAKIAGGFRSVTGLGGELAWVKAEQNGLIAISEKLKEMNHAINILKDVSVKQTGATMSTRQSGIKVSKGDVVVSINNSGIKIQYGISVKNYQTPKSSLKVPHVTIGTYSNFYELATGTTSGIGRPISPYNLVHYAASHSSYTKSSIKKQSKGNTTEAQLKESWDEVRNFVAIRNLLNILAGEAIGQDGADNVIVLVINGKMFRIDEILKKVKNATLSVATGGSISRDSLKKANVWNPDNEYDGNEDDAKERSEKAWNSTIKTLQAGKLRVTLNGIAALM